MKMRSQSSKTQQGFAAIFVVMTLMTLLALIAIGFSRLMNREVRQSLDRQLSIAAYYASESGINDAQNYVEATSNSIDNCKVPASSYFVDDGDISGDGTFKYTCVIVNPTPKELKLVIPAGSTKIVRLSGTSLNALSRLYIGWQNSAGYENGPLPLGTYGQLPKQTGVANDNTGLLRVGVYPMVDNCTDVDGHGDRLTRYSKAADSTDAALECASRNYFLYPSTGKAPAPDCSYTRLVNSNGCVNYADAYDDGGIVPGRCIDPAETLSTSFSIQADKAYCNAIINNLPPLNGARAVSAYYLRLTATYKSLRVFIQAADGSTPPPNSLAISDAQAIIDSTGRGNDILRRIQVNAPLQDDIPPLNYGLQSMESICKLFRVPVPDQGLYGQATRDPASDIYNTDGSCNSVPSGFTYIDPGGIPPIGDYPPPTINSFTASPSSFPEGESHVITLTWSSTTADFCSASGGPWSGSDLQPADSKSSDSAINSSTTFKISCTGPGGTTVANTTVLMILPPPPPPPDCSDYSLSVGSGGGSYGASVGGKNPCGEGIAQCNAFNGGGGSIAELFVHGATYPPSVSGGTPPGTAYVGCWSTDGRFASG